MSVSPRPRSGVAALRLVPAAPPDEPDAALVARALDGDAMALRALYDRHLQQLGGLCLRLLRNRADAEEVVQESFVIAFDKLGTLREPAQFRSWLVTIAVRRIRRRLRNERLRRLLGFGSSPLPLEALAAPASPEEARSELRALDVALSTLPDAERLPWMLRHVDDEPLDSIAASCNCSLATVKRRIASAEARLARVYEGFGPRRPEPESPPSVKRPR